MAESGQKTWNWKLRSPSKFPINSIFILVKCKFATVRPMDSKIGIDFVQGSNKETSIKLDNWKRGDTKMLWFKSLCHEIGAQKSWQQLGIPFISG